MTTKRTILVSAKDQTAINFVIDELEEVAPEAIAALSGFEPILGKTTAFGAGEPEIKTIRLVADIENPTGEANVDMDKILECLREIEAKFSIELELIQKTK